MENKMPDAPDEPPASPWSKEGQPVPDEHLIIGATVVLARHSGGLTNRRADATMREIIARDWVAQLRRSGYRITFGPGAPEHGTPAGTAAGAMVKP
jgi:hypothetical protein